MTPLRVVIVGAGGLGGYLGAVLHRTGTDVCLVARGAHLEALREGGLQVSELGGEDRLQPEIVSDIRDAGRADVAFVTVKAYSLPDVLPGVVELARGGAVVVPLLNGVEAAAALEKAGVPPMYLAPGVAYVTAFLTGPGRVERQGGHGRLILGLPGAGAPTETVRLLAQSLELGGIEVTLSGEIDVEAWRKMLVVCALTACCALTRSPIGPVRELATGRAFMEEAVREGAAVARARGTPLSEAHEEAALGVLDGFPHDFHPSLIHDLERGRPTEVDALNGALSRLGRELDVRTPVHDAATCAIELAEQAARPEPGGE